MDLGFQHVFLQGDPNSPTLLLLHGTGADEHDLLDLGSAVAPQASLLSPRGKVLENSMPRFFQRKAEGVFDMDDLAFRANELAQFIVAAKQHYQIAVPLIALGYSNGANIAAYLILHHPDVLDGAVLLRAMMPYDVKGTPDLSEKRVLMLSGLMDPMIPLPQSEKLASVLQSAGADVTHRIKPVSHSLVLSDTMDIKTWLGE